MKKYLYILALFLILVVTGTAIYFSTKWRTGNPLLNIIIEGNYTVADSEIINYSHLKTDSSILIEEIDLKLLEERILKNKEIKKVRSELLLPSTIKLLIIEKNPLAIVNLEKEIKLVDEELEFIPVTNEAKVYDLPIINGIIKNGEIDKEDLSKGVFIISSLIKKSKYLQTMISEVNFSDSNNIYLYANENAVPFILSKETDKSITNKIFQDNINFRLLVLKKYFEFIYNDEKNNNVEYVDLRYPTQVIIKYN